MGNDIEIRVKVANNTGTGLTAVNASLRQLENRAQATSRALRTLSTAGNVRVSATLDDRTSSGIRSIKTALRELKQQSPVRLSVTFDGQATQITAAATAMRDLRGDTRQTGTALDGVAVRAAAAAAALNSLQQQAEDASRALRTLRGRAAAAAAAMGELRASTTGAGNGLRTFNTRAQTANTRLGDLGDRTRTLRSDTDDLDGSMRRLTGTLGGLRGSMGTLRTSAGGGGGAGGAMEKLKSVAITLAPALIPVAASLVPIAVQAGAAGIAVGVFGAALLGQLSAVKDAADAEKKYTDAVKKHGPASQQAAQAEALYLDQVRGMDPATRRAAAALTVLKDQYKQWSKSLAGTTMPVFTKGLAVAGALFPKLTPVVKGAAGELNRFMTILAGGVNSSGFSKFMDSFAKFATGALSKANDGLVRFMRTMSGGAGSAQFTQFMEYAQRVGPAVGETLLNLSKALVHLVSAASETGVSMLTLVNSFAKLVNAIPTSVLSTLLQFVVVFKAVKLAAAGMAAMGGLTAFATSIGAMRTAAAGATGPLASLGAAFGALSRTAKVALIGAGIGILVLALSRLSNIGKQAPPDVDRLTTSLTKLGKSGKVTGEAARVFGKDLGGLADSLRTLSRPSNLDKTQQFLTSLVGMDSTPVEDAKKNLDGADKALANLVKGGKADIAAAAVEKLSKGMQKGGMSAKELRSKLDDYKAALADQALEQQLAAQAMGLFGDQALAVQGKLDAQKQSADGLRGAIQALNDVNRQGLGGMIGFEAAIDAASKAARDNAGALSMTNGVLNLGSEKARNAASALQDLADKTDGAAASARESGSSWETVNGIYSRGRTELIKNAEAMGLSKAEAKALADQILKIPDKTSKVKMNAEDAKAGLEAFNAAVKRSPGSKSVTLKTLSKSAEAILESFGYKVKRLPNGKVTVSAKTGSALSGIRNIAGAIAALRSKSVTITTNHVNKFTSVQNGVTVAKRDYATGGRVRGYADGGGLQHFPGGGYVEGPGGPKSDSILATFASGAMASVSDTEYVVQSSAVKKYGVAFMDALNAGRLKVAGFAKGGQTKAQKAAKAQAASEQQARHDAMPNLTVSHFGQMAGYKRSEFGSALAKPDSLGSLVDSLNQWRHMIEKMTHGATESKLLKALDSTGKKLLTYEKQLNSVNASLGKAKDKLNTLKDSASQLASSVKSGILGSANITRGASGDAPVTVSSIMGGLTQSRDKATAFASALKELQKKGLSASLIQQIAEAGVEGGGLETAGALLGASSSEIKSVNSLQGQINTAATSAGKTTADSVYAAAIKMQERTVKELTRQQQKLTTAMDKLTKAMEKAIEKAIGKKAAGGIVGAAASGGIRSGLTWVGEHGPELADLPVGSRVWSNPDSRRKAQAPWASMLNTPRGGGVRRAAAPVGGGPVEVLLELRSSGSETDEFLLKILRRAIRVRGGNAQVVLTGRQA